MKAPGQPIHRAQTANSLPSPPPIQPAANIPMPRTKAPTPTARQRPIWASCAPQIRAVGTKAASRASEIQLGIV